MWLSDFWKSIFKNSEKKNVMMQNIASGYTPILQQFGNDVYISDLVNNAIERRANEISKLDIKSVVMMQSSVRTVNDDLTRLFREKPNPWQTTSDFLSSIEWIRLKHGNCFIYPQYDWVMGSDGIKRKRFKAFYPLTPSSFEVGIDDDGVTEIKFIFSDTSGYQMTIPYSELIHLKWRRGTNKILGGNDFGYVENRDTLKALDSVTKIMDGLPKSIEASLQINGVYHALTMVDADKMSKERDRFEKQINTSASGIVATDYAGEFTPVNISQASISADVLEFLKSTIVQRYGVSFEIMAGNPTDDQQEAFYQIALEDFINQFEQAFTATCFTQREKDVGHKIRAYYDRLKKISITKAIDIANYATSTGAMTLNQINEMFGYPPFEGGDRRLQSLNYVNVEIVDKYQMDEKTQEGEANE